MVLQHNQDEVGDAGDHVEEVDGEEDVDGEIEEVEKEVQVVEEKDNVDDDDERVSPTKGTTAAA